MKKIVFAAIAVLGVSACGAVDRPMVVSAPPDNPQAHQMSWGAANIPVARDSRFGVLFTGGGGG